MVGRHYRSDSDPSVLRQNLQLICVINLHYSNNEREGIAQREPRNSAAKYSDKGGAVIFFTYPTLIIRISVTATFPIGQIILLNALSRLEYFPDYRGLLLMNGHPVHVFYSQAAKACV